MSKPRLVAGIDEVGRGCIAGPVVAAVVILDKNELIPDLADSKKLTVKRREYLSKQIQEKSLAYSVGRAEASEIDSINILQASLLAMKRAYSGLAVQPDWTLVDGKDYPEISCIGETVIQGDQTVPEISAASILAKVARDKEMEFLDKLYPGYDFLKHKGYPTKLHLQKLTQLGVAEIYRKSFGPVKKIVTE